MPGVLVKVLVMAGADCKLNGARLCAKQSSTTAALQEISFQLANNFDDCRERGVGSHLHASLRYLCFLLFHPLGYVI